MRSRALMCAARSDRAANKPKRSSRETDLYGACMWVLLPLGRSRIARDEHARREHPDVSKLKPAPRGRRHRLQGAQSKAPQETPTVIGLPGAAHAVPLVGEAPATHANYQVTNVVRAADLWLRQRTEAAEIAPRGRYGQPADREDARPRSSLAKRQFRTSPPPFVSGGVEWHRKRVWQANLHVKHANVSMTENFGRQPWYYGKRMEEMIRWSSIRGVRFAVLEDVIFIDLPGPRLAGSPVSSAPESTAGKSRSRGIRAVNTKLARARPRAARRGEHGGG